jgi:Lon protease-like protein
VTVWPDAASGPAAADRRDALARLLRRLLALKAELGDPAVAATVELDADPSVATWQAAALAPLGPLDSQRVLEVDRPDARLELVLSLLGEEVAVLAQRVAGG